MGGYQNGGTLKHHKDIWRFYVDVGWDVLI